MNGAIRFTVTYLNHTKGDCRGSLPFLQQAALFIFARKIIARTFISCDKFLTKNPCSMLLKKPFYILGHNPNSLEEAKDFLDSGANALEPDVVHAEGRYYISHLPKVSYSDTPTLEEYLAGLRTMLIENQYNLALIVWDIKDTDFDPTHFMSVVKANFSGGVCEGVTMLITHSDDHAFLNRYRGDYPNVGVGVDESDVPPAELQDIFLAAGQQRFTYADGITTFLAKPGVYLNITHALRTRFLRNKRSFSLVYTWVLSLEGSMRKYLDTYIDAIMVDAVTVPKLLAILASPPYNEVYSLARNGYNPFDTPPRPAYILLISTRDRLFAGTDANFSFTLTGESGQSRTRLPYNGNTEGALERNSITPVMMEGTNIGNISSLIIEALTAGPGAGWLPEKIVVESALLPGPITFLFGEEQWISSKNGAVTRYPASRG